MKRAMKRKQKRGFGPRLSREGVDVLIVHLEMEIADHEGRKDDFLTRVDESQQEITRRLLWIQALREVISR